MTAEQALLRLENGNRCFAEGLTGREPERRHARRSQLVEDQAPFAIILGCSDSRVPAEIVFNQGLGDLFVIRVAGHVVAPSQIGSIEFAVDRYATPLVVVLGHTHCGAVTAAVDDTARLSASRSPNLGFIVKSIRPCVEVVAKSNPELTRSELIERVTRENIRATVNKLRCGSEVLYPLIRAKRLRILGAEYSLESGRVELLRDTLWNV